MVMTEGGTDKDKDGQTKKEGRYDLVMAGDLKSEIILNIIFRDSRAISHISKTTWSMIFYHLQCVHIGHISSF